MDSEIASAVKVFEEIEKLRRGLDAKLSHLQRNMRCPDCDTDWMPKSWEPCPSCGSENTRLLKKKRKCLDCEHVWEPTGNICPKCGGENSVNSPRDDLYIREVALPRLRTEEEFYEGQMRKMVQESPAWPWAEKVKGAGLTTIGRLIGKTDIHRLGTVSSMWAHCGFGLYSDGTRQRKRKGEKIDYDAQLQSNCVMLGESLLRAKDSYYEFYLKEKERWPDLSDAHRHNRAYRHMIKLFLSHLWETWRKAEGLPVPEPYVFAILKHPEGHYITPQEMQKKPSEDR